MKNLAKALAGTVAAGVLAVSSASPALARDRDGGVIAGALIIGGIAAVAAGAGGKNHDDYGYGRDYRYGRAGYGYGYGNPRDAVSLCVRAAENGASRHSYGRANVTRITGVRNKRDGVDVKGRIAVDDRGHGWRDSGYDTGSFTCKIRYGRIVDIDYSGVRGLR